ncbi:MAG: hypothetical protein FWD78_02930 [Treponema sp.]|nr:hypothetical protein [Treponema sp.]
MPSFIYDAFNDFGVTSAEGEFPNTINLGEASIERMTVDLKLPSGPLASGTVILSIKGSDAANGSYTTIVTGEELTSADIQKGYGLPVPASKYQYLKAEIEGKFGGKLQAIINTYIGK